VNLSRVLSPSLAKGSAGPASVERRASAGREASSSRALSAAMTATRRPRGARAEDERGSVVHRGDHPRLLLLGPYVRPWSTSQDVLDRSLRTARRCVDSRKRTRETQRLVSTIRHELSAVMQRAEHARASRLLGWNEEPRLRSGSAHDLRHCRRSQRPLLSRRLLGNQVRAAGAKSLRTEGARVKVVRPRHGGRVATFARSRRLPLRKQPPRGHAPAREKARRQEHQTRSRIDLASGRTS